MDPAPTEGPAPSVSEVLNQVVFPPLVMDANPSSCCFTVQLVHITFILLINNG